LGLFIQGALVGGRGRVVGDPGLNWALEKPSADFKWLCRSSYDVMEGGGLGVG